MQRTVFLFAFSLLLISSCITDRDFPKIDNPIEHPDYELMYYWNFNDITNNNALITPAYTKGGASLNYQGSYFDPVSEGSEVNVRLSSEAGSALRLRNPSGAFIISVPTTGYKNVVLSYAATRTGSGSQTQTISYTIDGTNYLQNGLSQTSFSVMEDIFSLVQLNFTDIDGADNNPNFKIKIEFDEPSSQIQNGNNRIDNITLDGIPTEEGGTNPTDPEEPQEPDNELYLFHYWNFNTLSSGNNPEIAPNTGNGTLEYSGSYYDRVSPGSDTNARNEDTAGYALRLRNQSGDFIIGIPTAGYKNIVVKYAATRTGSGSQTQTISYTVDGINYIKTGLSQTEFTITEDDIVYSLYEVDFSSISGVNNNANFKIKVEFDQPSSTISNGNNRIDNITVEGNAL